MLQLRSAFIFLVITTACSKPLPALEGIDRDKWTSDKNACSGDRTSMKQAMGTEMEKLKGLAEMDVITLLGRPDENELYKRNQKFYYYYLTPGPDCPEHPPIPDKLVIRFNAMGFAQLVSMESQ